MEYRREVTWGVYRANVGQAVGSATLEHVWPRTPNRSVFPRIARLGRAGAAGDLWGLICTVLRVHLHSGLVDDGILCLLDANLFFLVDISLFCFVDNELFRLVGASHVFVGRFIDSAPFAADVGANNRSSVNAGDPDLKRGLPASRSSQRYNSA